MAYQLIYQVTFSQDCEGYGDKPTQNNAYQQDAADVKQRYIDEGLIQSQITIHEDEENRTKRVQILFASQQAHDDYIAEMKALPQTDRPGVTVERLSHGSI